MGLDPPPIPEPSVFVAHFGGRTKTQAVATVFSLRNAGIGARIAFAAGRRSLKSQMREAGRYAASFVVIVGESEMNAGQVTVRDMIASEQVSVPIGELDTWLKKQLMI
jgi:histidyl-tRNA synthetase